MEKKAVVVTRRELLERWRGIEDDDDDDDHIDHPHKRHRLHQLKEQWFSDAFNFLIRLPSDKHIWCDFWDLMGPLLETFYNYFRDEPRDSPLKMLWTRISEEMRQCTQCICQHHQAQETYNTEYEPGSIGILLDVLRTLDEERVSKHLKEINARIARGERNAPADAEVVCVMFEVLMFPYLLDDQSLGAEFETFIEVIDDSHELALAGHQQYPGVYALLFLKSRRVRSVGFRLAGHMGKLRRSVDLDPLQPLLKKCISYLETDTVSLAAELSRPRVQLDRITVWLGIKAMLGFLEPPAFEEGILDRYPVFLSIVLNHISDDSLEFSCAVNCLRLLFEMLGCKLWLRSTLSPSVMRNTLLGQCFHTRNEKSHKEIFDLFQPFLQSLEALQDGEYEMQRRHFVYFLLHQVTVSSNFSLLMRKKACQIALLIVHRGYKMNPPCPPYECAHMWGPSLVSSLKDLSLHSALRQPAFDLIQTIIVSDASVLAATILNNHLDNDGMRPTECNDERDEEILFGHDIEDGISCWKEFYLQSRVTLLVYRGWMCIPMLWFDVLVGIDPLILPVSFAKAVFWAISRFSMVEPENNIKVDTSIGNWLTTCASEISYLFGWKVPSGSDDGGDGTLSKNSVNVSKLYMPLIRTFRRLASHFIVRMEQGELTKQWTWEPMMAESLILLLFDPNDNDRQVSRHILEQFSDERNLTSGLQFLCSSQSSLAAILLGVRHALKLVLLDSVLLKFQMLHHFFFVLCKLIKEGNSSTQSMGDSSAGLSKISQFSSQGGFLKQPDFATKEDNLYSSVVSSPFWEKFSCIVSEISWPSIVKCLAKGKAFVDHKISQMTCIRLLEILPLIFKRLCRNSGIIMKYVADMEWLHDLVVWGRSSLAVVVRYWKQTLASLLGLLTKSCSDISASSVKDLEKLISSDNIEIDQLNDQVARLSVSFMDESSFTFKNRRMKSKSLLSGELLHGRNLLVDNVDAFSPKDEAPHPYSEKVIDKETANLIVLSDDEKEPEIVADQVIQSCVGSSQYAFDTEASCTNPTGSVLHSDLLQNVDSGRSSLQNRFEALPEGSSQECSGLSIPKFELDNDEGKQGPASSAKSKIIDVKEKDEISTTCCQTLSDSNLIGENTDSRRVESSVSQLGCNLKRSSERCAGLRSKDQKKVDKILAGSQKVINSVVHDTEEDLWEFSFFKSAKLPGSLYSKPSNSGPKRQVIQLSLPVENRSGHWRGNGGERRFKAPRLDDWYKSILEIDYFATVGLASADPNENKKVCKLKEVPVCFTSPNEYIEVFRPLVLEEFKAQLHSSFQEVASTEEMCCGNLSVLSVERIDDFHIVRCVHDDTDPTGSRSCLENDLILLTRQPLPCSSYDIHMVGKVERREIDNKRKLTILVIRLYLQNGCSRLNRARKYLVERSKWCINRLMSIIPQLREFQALSSIWEIPLLPVILSPLGTYGCHNSRRENLSKLPQPLQQVLQSSYNDSQLQAISSAIGSSDFKKDFELSLIQGPPGTGKTRTIVAIVSGLFAYSQLRDGKKSLYQDPKSAAVSSFSRVKIKQSAAIARAWQDAALARQLNEDGERNIKPLASSCRGRVLICAQSNAAVDELVSRITTEGLYGSDGLMYKPYLVRVGNAKTVHPNSLTFFIDTLVDHRLTEERVKDGKSETGGDSLSILRSNLESLVDRIRFYEAKRVNLRDGNLDSRNCLGEAVKECEMKELSDAELESELRRLYEKKKAIYKDLANAQAQEKKANEESKALKHKLRKAILKEAEIVVTTLSGCGGDLYSVCAESVSSHKFSSSSESTLFDAVVIDEAAQALEPATLIPLQLLKSKGTRCIMVGDPKQLPATVFSNIASKYLFQCSMFERLQRAGHPITMLTQQYRMHPEICHFPALHFYDGKLKNGNQMSSKTAVFHETKGLGPYVFFDIIDGQESHGKNSSALSLYNECEADAAVEVLRFFKKRYPLEFIGGRIGVLTPYRCQLSILRSRFAHAFGSSVVADVEFNTVDGFQGREVDILLLSTVRAAEPCSKVQRSNSSSIGFVADVRRMNVALTRAKFSLWILGNARTLQTNENWAALLEDAGKRNLVIPVRKPYSCIFELGLNKNSALKGPRNHLGQLQHVDKVKNIDEYADVQKKSGKYTSERKRKSMVNGAYSGAAMGENEHFLATKKAVKGSKRKVTGAHDSPSIKDASTVTENNKCQISKGLKCSDRGSQLHGHRSSGKRNTKLHIEGGRADLGNENNDGKVRINLEHLGKVKGATCMQLKPASSRQCLESSKDEKMHLGTRVTSSKWNLLETDVRDDTASSQVEIPKDKDTIMKRKQQRDAVDALLPSALISSRKPKSSLKSSSVKRTLSSTSAEGRAIRPSKSKKVHDR